MTDGELEFREEVKMVIRRHDPDADDLRDLAGSLEDLADRYEATEEVL
ncbi:hypothetical protein [Natrinema thermotolerans]|nr:hypothetical protein [Natrinema thermotolerans]